MIKLCDFGSATTKRIHPDHSWTQIQRGLAEEEVRENESWIVSIYCGHDTHTHTHVVRAVYPNLFFFSLLSIVLTSSSPLPVACSFCCPEKIACHNPMLMCSEYWLYPLMLDARVQWVLAISLDARCSCAVSAGYIP